MSCKDQDGKWLVFHSGVLPCLARGFFIISLKKYACPSVFDERLEARLTLRIFLIFF